MKLHSDITINGKKYSKGDEIAWYAIYPFFLLHMLIFGASGFFMAYADQRPDLLFLYMHGGIAILVYTIFYLTMFGRDEVKWLFINSALGVLGIYTQMGWILTVFDKNITDYPLEVHVIPFLYFVLYTFLLRQAVLDFSKAREDEQRQKTIENRYTLILTLGYVVTYIFAG